MRLRTLVLVVMALTLGLLTVSGSAAAAATPTCRSSQLRVSLGAAQGATGTLYRPVILTNAGGTCALWGAPAIQPVNGARRPVGPASRSASVGEMPVRHVLTHGQSVSAPFGVVPVTNYPSARCRAASAAGIRVSLLPFLHPIYLRIALRSCTLQASTSTGLLVAGPRGY